MTKKEFILQHKAYEQGRIDAWRHIKSVCDSCIRAHKEQITRRRLEQIAELNKHMWKDEMKVNISEEKVKEL